MVTAHGAYVLVNTVGAAYAEMKIALPNIDASQLTADDFLLGFIRASLHPGTGRIGHRC